MPRVNRSTKNKAGKSYTCDVCSKGITAGQDYYSWSFRRRHVECGYPKRSELTHSKMSAVYAAVESAEESISTASDVDSLAEALRNVAESAREVAQEYMDAVEAMNMSGAGTENEERADSLNAFADEIESEADDIESETWEAEENEDADNEANEQTDQNGDTEAEWLENQKDRARDALGNLEL